MVPDHLGLLKEGEAFVHVKDDLMGRLPEATHLLAMRIPSYFSGDLRKLRLCTYETLLGRARDVDNAKTIDAKDEKDAQSISSSVHRCVGFFKNFKNGLVLSTRGERSEADRMSGGDFDGDTAWVCWDPELVHTISFEDGEATTGPKFRIVCSDEEHRLVEDSSTSDFLRFVRHFRTHQRQLGLLSNLLETVFNRKGIDDALSKAIGTEAFLQVDHPFFLRKLVGGVEREANRLIKPSWKNTSLSRKSTSGRAVCKMYQFAVGEVHKILSAFTDTHDYTYRNPQIMSVVHNALSGGQASVKEVEQLREEMHEETKEHDATFCGLYRRWDKRRDKRNQNKDIGRSMEKYYRGRRAYLCNKYKDNYSKRMLMFAVLYEQSSNYYERKEKVNKFAWRVASEWLLFIVAEQNKLQSENRATLVMTSTMEHWVLSFMRRSRPTKKRQRFKN